MMRRSVKCAVRHNVLTRSPDQFANDLTGNIHNFTTYLMLYTMTYTKKILYIVYAANFLKVNPIVYMKCLLYRTLPNLNTKALLKIKRQT